MDTMVKRKGKVIFGTNVLAYVPKPTEEDEDDV
jgi:hypothetical protein